MMLYATPSIAEDNNNNVGWASTISLATGQTIVGIGVQGDNTTGAVFIGHGDIYLKLDPDGTVTLHGTKNKDEVVEAVLSGLKVIIGLNPYYCNDKFYPKGFGLQK